MKFAIIVEIPGDDADARSVRETAQETLGEALEEAGGKIVEVKTIKKKD